MCSFQVTPNPSVLHRKARHVTSNDGITRDGMTGRMRDLPPHDGTMRDIPHNTSDPYRRHKRVKYVTLTTRSFTSPTPPSPIIRTYIAYASESGTAQKLAERIHTTLMARFNTSRPGRKLFSSKVVNVEEILWVDAAELILFVASTTGEGDPPRNGRRFYDNCLMFRYFDYLPLENVHFAVLGLGSRLYKDNYAAFGINLDRVAGDLGGTRVLPVVKCDTGAAMEDTFLAWLEDLMPRVDLICQGRQLVHVVDNSTAPPGRTEKDIMGDLQNMAAQAGVSLQVRRTTEPVYSSAIEMSNEKSLD